MSEAAARELTIDELARETGMTVRNIRAHQSAACCRRRRCARARATTGPSTSPGCA